MATLEEWAEKIGWKYEDRDGRGKVLYAGDQYMGCEGTQAFEETVDVAEQEIAALKARVAELEVERDDWRTRYGLENEAYQDLFQQLSEREAKDCKPLAYSDALPNCKSWEKVTRT